MHISLYCIDVYLNACVSAYRYNICILIATLHVFVFTTYPLSLGNTAYFTVHKLLHM